MRTNDLKSRIRAAYNIVRYGRGHFRMMTCGKCGSIIIHRISENEVNTNFFKDGYQIDQVWSEFSQCQKCGAVCKEIQLWNFDGDPLKIDKEITVKREDK